MSELVLEISGLNGLVLAGKGETIVGSLTDNPLFKETPISTEALSLTSTLYRRAFETTFKGDEAGQEAKANLKKKVVLNIKLIGNEVSNLILKGLLNETLNENTAAELALSAGFGKRKKPSKSQAVKQIYGLKVRNNEALGCMDLVWTKSEIATNYIIQYRKKGEAIWTEVFASISKTMIKDLGRAQEYEFRVAGIKGKDRGNFSTIVSEIAL